MFLNTRLATTGHFISLEGVDGAGKTTHLKWLVDHLNALRVPLVVSREPGGTPLGESLRELVLHQEMSIETEVLLMFAARQQHLQSTIFPALQEGKWVVCDRFTDASYAYQGGGRGLSIEKISMLEHWVHADFQPDLTLLFDVPPEVSFERVRQARNPDRFEELDITFFERVREAYLLRAARDPLRFHLIDANRPISVIQADLQTIISNYLEGKRHG